MKKKTINLTNKKDNLENDLKLESIKNNSSDEENISDILNENDTETTSQIFKEEDWRTTEELKALTFLVKSLYQIQHLRIGLGNRIYAHCAVNLGIKPGDKKEDQKKASIILKQLEVEYKDITTALANTILSEELRTMMEKKKINIDAMILSNPDAWITKDTKKINKAIDTAIKETDNEDTMYLVKHFKNGIIKNDAEFYMARMWSQLRSIESNISDELANLIKNCHFDIWDSFLVDVSGIGPTLASCLISTINIKKCYTVQSLWKYCGLDVAEDGTGRSRRTEHMVEKEFINKDGEKKKRMSLTYNPWIKTKLMGTLAGMFMLHNKDYRAIYDDIKLRLNESERPQMKRQKTKNGIPVIDKKTGKAIMIEEYPKARINMMSQRYMIKMFLLDYWVHARLLMGETLAVPYAQKELGYQCKFRTLIKDTDGKSKFTRVDFVEDLNLDILRKIQEGPVSKYAR